MGKLSVYDQIVIKNLKRRRDGCFSNCFINFCLKEEEEEIYLPRTITISNKKNTMLKLARSRLPEKQNAIYAGRQHC